jgi:hypothetical protein
MPEIDQDMFQKFMEFMESQTPANPADDEEMEIWDESGKGMRAKRSVLKPFLQQFGIDMDAPASDPDNTGSESDPNGTKPKPKGRQAASQPASGVARKYFVKPK